MPDFFICSFVFASLLKTALLKYNYKNYICLECTDLCFDTCEIITAIKIVNISITPKSFLVPICTSSIHLHLPRRAFIYFLLLYISFNFLKFYINGLIQNIFFLVWLFSTQINYFEIYSCCCINE